MMSRRGENIHKRKDGRWEGRLKTGSDPRGRTRYRSVYGRTYGEIRAKMAAVLRGEHPVGSRSEPCFADVLEMWLAANRIRLKGATENKYRSIIEAHILPTLSEMPLSRMNAAEVNRFLHEKMSSGRLDGTGGLSSSYVRSIMLVISSALSYAVREGMRRPLTNPIHKPPPSAQQPAVLSADDAKKLSAYALGCGDETGTGVLLSLYAGLRIGEVCALEWKDIDFAAEVLHVRRTVSRVRSADGGARKSELILDTPKTKTSSRDIPITAWLMSALRGARERAVSPFVASRGDSFVSPRTYEYRYRRMLERCGIAPVNYHALRHTFATRCIDTGVDVKTLSEILGHADASITLNTYVHPSMEQKRQQLEKLSDDSGRTRGQSG